MWRGKGHGIIEQQAAKGSSVQAGEPQRIQREEQRQIIAPGKLSREGTAARYAAVIVVEPFDIEIIKVVFHGG